MGKTTDKLDKKEELEKKKNIYEKAEHVQQETVTVISAFNNEKNKKCIWYESCFFFHHSTTQNIIKMDRENTFPSEYNKAIFSIKWKAIIVNNTIANNIVC